MVEYVQGRRVRVEAGRGAGIQKVVVQKTGYGFVGEKSIDEGPLSLSVTRRRERWACWVQRGGRGRKVGMILFGGGMDGVD